MDGYVSLTFLACFRAVQSTMSEQLPSMPWEDRVAIVRRHFEKKGYRVHSGLQFGCELVLYADDPERVHSDFCVHVVREGTYSLTHVRVEGFHVLSLLVADGRLDWRTMQTLVRSMPDLHKTLIIARVQQVDGAFEVDEMAIATEHAPFRHKSEKKEVGAQRKKARIDSTDAGDDASAENVDERNE